MNRYGRCAAACLVATALVAQFTRDAFADAGIVGPVFRQLLMEGDPVPKNAEVDTLRDGKGRLRPRVVMDQATCEGAWAGIAQEEAIGDPTRIDLAKERAVKLGCIKARP